MPNDQQTQVATPLTAQELLDSFLRGRAREVTGLVTSRGADGKTLALWREAGLDIQLV